MENESDLDYMHVPPDECSGFCGESIGTYFCRICPSDLLPKREDFPPMHAASLCTWTWNTSRAVYRFPFALRMLWMLVLLCCWSCEIGRFISFNELSFHGGAFGPSFGSSSFVWNQAHTTLNGLCGSAIHSSLLREL